MPDNESQQMLPDVVEFYRFRGRRSKSRSHFDSRKLHVLPFDDFISYADYILLLVGSAKFVCLCAPKWAAGHLASAQLSRCLHSRHSRKA